MCTDCKLGGHDVFTFVYIFMGIYLFAIYIQSVGDLNSCLETVQSSNMLHYTQKVLPHTHSVYIFKILDYHINYNDQI
jgi:hypothetical protein